MVYSFLNVSATLVGPGMKVELGSGAAAADEGITIESTEDKNVMTIGADGKGQHSLVANDAVTVTVRLLKTSPVNQILMIAYDTQSVSSALWGQNILTLTDSARGDVTTVLNMAFKKKPTLTYAKEGGTMEWAFDGLSGHT